MTKFRSKVTKFPYYEISQISFVNFVKYGTIILHNFVKLCPLIIPDDPVCVCSTGKMKAAARRGMRQDRRSLRFMTVTVYEIRKTKGVNSLNRHNGVSESEKKSGV